MSLRSAEAFVLEAEQLAATPHMSFGQPAVLIEHAIEAFRAIGGQQARIEQLIKILEGYQQKFVVQMIPLSEKMDLDALQPNAKAQVTQSTVRDVIFAFAMLSASQKVTLLEKSVRETSNEYLFQAFFSTSMLSGTGKTVAKQPPLEKGADEASSAFRAHMYRQARTHREIIVLGLIEPARQHIVDQHILRYEDIGELVWHSPIVPPDRQRIVIEGLLAGFNGNFLVSTHLLVPQIEHMIRELLTNYGHRTAGYDAQGIQEEHDLNTTLRHPDLPRILGEDLTFDLRGLLIERFGSIYGTSLRMGCGATKASIW